MYIYHISIYVLCIIIRYFIILIHSCIYLNDPECVQECSCIPLVEPYQDVHKNRACFKSATVFSIFRGFKLADL